MPDTFLKNAMCDVTVFDRALDEGRSSITKASSPQFANLNKTVAMVCSQYGIKDNSDQIVGHETPEGELYHTHPWEGLPQVIMHDEETPAFAIHPESKDIHITKGLYDTLKNDELRAVVVLQTCMLARHPEHAGEYSAKTTQYATAGAAIAAVSGGIVAAASVMAGDAKKGKEAKKKGETIYIPAEPGQTTRRQILKGMGVGGILGLVGGFVRGKSADDKREYTGWMEAALADYRQLNNDPHGLKLGAALAAMNTEVGKQFGEAEAQKYAPEIGAFLAMAWNTPPNTHLMPLPPTEVTRSRK